MLTVTDAALEYLADAIGKIDEPKPTDACFRIPMDGGKLTLTVGSAEAADTTFQHKGVTLLVVSQEVAKRCEERTLDADQLGNLLLT